MESILGIQAGLLLGKFLAQIFASVRYGWINQAC